MSQTALVTTHHFNGSPVRTINKDGKVWFVACDVAARLGYGGKDMRKAFGHVSAKWVSTDRIGGKGGANVFIVCEEGVNQFLMRSDKPAAKPFQEWLAGEVLPSIRRTGSYTAPNAKPAQPETPSDPILAQLAAMMAMRQTQVEQEARLAVLEAKVEEVAARPALPAPTESGTLYMSVLGFCRSRNVSVPGREMADLGKRCADRARSAGARIGKVSHDYWGAVNSYPIRILEEVFGELRLI